METAYAEYAYRQADAKARQLIAEGVTGDALHDAVVAVYRDCHEDLIDDEEANVTAQSIIAACEEETEGDEEGESWKSA